MTQNRIPILWSIDDALATSQCAVMLVTPVSPLGRHGFLIPAPHISPVIDRFRRFFFAFVCQPFSLLSKKLS